MMDTVFIYALNCPITGRTRYIGKAVDPQARYQKHLKESIREKSHKANWIRSLASAEKVPILEVLDEVLEAEWQSWEIAYIEFFRESGFDLVNGTLGGDGVVPTEAVREKLRAAALGNKKSLGKRPSPETRIRLSEAAKGNRKTFGKRYSPEVRAHYSEAKRLWWANKKKQICLK